MKLSLHCPGEKQLANAPLCVSRLFATHLGIRNAPPVVVTGCPRTTPKVQNFLSKSAFSHDSMTYYNSFACNIRSLILRNQYQHYSASASERTTCLASQMELFRPCCWNATLNSSSIAQNIALRIPVELQ